MTRTGMTEAELMEYVAVMEAALEAERQWRLNSLPALLGAQAREWEAVVRAVKAEADAAHLRRYGFAPEGFALVRISTEDRPWAAPDLTRSQAKRHAALINAYHETKERP